jgi:hypothetical protein
MGSITRTIANNLTVTKASQGTMVDVWRLASNYSMTSTASTITGWERDDTGTYGGVGTGMTESSGIFTFPSTGIYLIQAICSLNSAGNDSNYNELSIQISTDGGTGRTFRAGNSDDIQSGTNERGATTQLCTFDVTDTSTHKVLFRAFSQNTVNVYGDSSGNRTHVLFMKLSET